jgi:SAM-dependent methyltransferase
MAYAAGILEALHRTRSAFGLGSEAEQLANEIDRLLPSGDICWLEVGAGDGRNLAWLLTRLRADRRFAVTALEPASDRPRLRMEADLEWLRLPVEQYKPVQPLDWINVRHSAYYLRRPIEEIARLGRALAPTGGMSITHWSESCVLFALHRKICGREGTVPRPSFEDLAVQLAGRPELEIISATTFATEFIRTKVHTEAGVAAALYDLVRRDQPSTIRSDRRAAFIQAAVEDVPASCCRVNGVLVIRAR